jgi:hypothetical protein
MNKFLHLDLVLVLIITLALSGCGGSSGGGNDNNITVTVNPGEVTMEPGDIRQFSATVTGTNNTAVTWSVDPEEGGGNISTTGLYYAPLSVGTYYVVATSQADPTKSGKAKVNTVSVVTYNPDIDGNVFSNGIINSNGTQMSVGDKSDLTVMQVLVSFPLSLPAGATIQTATLRLYNFDNSNAHLTEEIKVQHLQTNFEPLAADDYVGAPNGLNPCASFSCPASGVGGWKEVNVTSSVREDYAASRSKSQFRLYRTTLTDSDAEWDYNGFYTSENGTNKPELVITYKL